MGGRTDLSRRKILKTAAAGGMLAAVFPSILKNRFRSVVAVDISPSELDEITVAELQEGMKSGKYSARSITESYLNRIDQIDKKGPAVNSMIE